MRVEDIDGLKTIHEKHFRNTFDIDVFNQKFQSLFTVVGDEGDLITLGGFRLIPEAVIVTDKDQPVRARVEALNEMLEMLSTVVRSNGHDSIHAFIQDQAWKHQLMSVGFLPTKGQSLFLPVR